MTYAIVNVADTGDTYGTFETGAEAGAKASEINATFREQGKPTRVRVVQQEAPAETTEDMVWAVGLDIPEHYCTELPSGIGDVGSYYWNWRAVQVPEASKAWRQREARRSGRSRIPWIEKPWWRDSEHWAIHYPYPSETDPSKIAFTKSEQHGKEDRQTVMRPGTYLARYFGDVLTESEIQEWALAWATEFAPVELEYARTADEIEEIYTNGPDSCMAYDASEFDGPCHPVRVYAGPDLELAYMRNGAGDITGRAIVWPAKKHHGWIYGDVERMVDALQREGYTPGSLAGARLARIECDGGFVVPFLDSVQMARDDGNYLIIDSCGSIHCDTTSGVSAGATCHNCGDGVSEDDSWHVEGETYCEHCYCDSFSYCPSCDETVSNDDISQGPDGEYRCGDCHREVVGTCGSCDGEAMREDMHAGPDYAYRCEDCYHDAVGICETCEGDVMRDDVDTEGNCPNCSEEETEPVGPARDARGRFCRVTDSTDPAQLPLTATPGGPGPQYECAGCGSSIVYRHDRHATGPYVTPDHPLCDTHGCYVERVRPIVAPYTVLPYTVVRWQESTGTA